MCACAQKLKLYAPAATYQEGRGVEVLVREIIVDPGTRAWLDRTLPTGHGAFGVLECVYEPNLSSWIVKKYRPDKNRGNFLDVTVISTLEAVVENIEPGELCWACGCMDPACGRAAAGQAMAAATAMAVDSERSGRNVVLGNDAASGPQRLFPLETDVVGAHADTSTYFRITPFSPRPPTP